MFDDDSIIGFKGGSSYILEIYILNFFTEKKKSGICFETSGHYGGGSGRGYRENRLASN